MKKVDVVAFDAETTSVRIESAKMHGFSVVREGLGGLYGDYYPRGAVPEEIVNLLEDNSVLKLAHNASFDRSILKRHGITVDNVLDTMTPPHLLGDLQLSLKHLAMMYFFEELEDYSEFSKRCPRPTIDDWRGYSVPQSKMCVRLYEALLPEVKKYGSRRILEDLLVPLVPVISDLELAGVAVDTAELDAIGVDCRERQVVSQQALDHHAGKHVNPNSPKQVSSLIFDTLGFKPKRFSDKTGQPTADEDVLKGIDHPVSKHILECRKYGKLAGTYAEKLPRMVHNGRLHTSYNICGARSGRLSSTDPNLQNIPARTADGRRIRKAFVAEPGNVFVGVDYDQLELRMMAMFSRDVVMCRAFRNGDDIHAQTAEGLSRLLGRTISRFIGKTLNFMIIYGAGVVIIMIETGLSRRDAARVRDGMFSLYSGIADWIKAQRLLLRETGYVRTLMGRVRKLAFSGGGYGFEDAAKEGINTIIQGSSAELVFMKMIEAWRVLRGSDVQMVLQGHDEVVYELPKHMLREVVHLMESIMPCYDYEIPFTVTIKHGDNWRDMEEVKGSKERQMKKFKVFA